MHFILYSVLIIFALGAKYKLHVYTGKKVWGKTFEYAFLGLSIIIQVLNYMMD